MPDARSLAMHQLMDAVDPVNGVGEYRVRVAREWMLKRSDHLSTEIVGLTAKMADLTVKLSKLEKKRDRLDRRKA